MQAAAGQYDTSLLSYGRALQLQPNDTSIFVAAKKVARLSNEQTMCKFLQIILLKVLLRQILTILLPSLAHEVEILSYF